MNRLLYFFIHPRFFFVGLLDRFGGCLPDKLYLKINYYLHTSHLLQLNPPRTFNEKIQWLKLYDRNPLYSSLIDKYSVKEYVAKIIGKEYIIPTLGVWNCPEDIDFDSLPQRFVLKTTHDGGGEGVIICDKNHLDVEAIKRKLHKSLKRNIYKSLREWPYKNIEPRIIAETFIQQSGDDAEELKDYKFFCFNGNPKFCQVKTHIGEKNFIDLFDMQWNLLPFSCLNPTHKHAEIIPKKPNNYELMIELVKKLCVVSNFARVDFYNVNGKIYFGEITLYPASGMGKFTPEKYDKIIGDLLVLNKETIK